MKQLFLFMGLFLLSGCGAATTSTDEPSPTTLPDPTTVESWNAGLSAQETTTSSSSKLDLDWTLPETTLDHLIVTTADDVGGVTLTVAVSAGETETQLSGLKSDTTYTMQVIGCIDEACTSQLQSESVEGSTPQEIWQIQGSGHSYKTADVVVPEGSTLAYAFQYGEGAPPSLEGLTRFYYNPSPTSSWGSGMRAALSKAGTYDSFTPTDNGIKLTCDTIRKQDCPKTGAYWITATQAIPLVRGGIQLFFEAMDLNAKMGNTTRNFTLMSQDGYVGEDFNVNAKRTTCGGTGSTDYATGADCEPTVILGVKGDVEAGNTGLKQVRQSKIGFPQLDSWLWDEAVGTFMAITGADSCNVTQDGLFYAQWDGENWDVEKNDRDCAKPLVEKAHGPVIVHLGESRYKLYYEAITGERIINSGKPLRVIYGDGAMTGDEKTLEFADWESESAARDVTFLWPDGTQLTADQESGLGDHFIFVPDANVDEQRMYMNLGGMDDDTPKEASQGLGTAILTNP